MAGLSEQDRKRLDGIVAQMVGNRESDTDIQAVVNDFKTKYGSSVPGVPNPLQANPARYTPVGLRPQDALPETPTVGQEALRNLPTSAAAWAKASAGLYPGSDTLPAGQTYSPTNPIQEIRDAAYNAYQMLRHPIESFARDPVGEVLLPITAFRKAQTNPQVRAGSRAVTKIAKSRLTGNPVEGTETNPTGPYFHERTTYDPQFRGPTPPTTGTPPTGTVNVPPAPPPNLGTQGQPARGPLVSPVAVKPPSRTGVIAQSGTIPGEITEGTSATSAQPATLPPPPNFDPKVWEAMDPKMRQGIWDARNRHLARQAQTANTAIPQEGTAIPKASPGAELPPPITASTPAGYTQQAMEQIAAKAKKTGAEMSHQNAYHVGDVSEHKALNVARHLNEQGVTASEYGKILRTAQQTGDWKPIDQINAAAYESGKAGGYQGYLPKNGYSGVSDARRAERANYQGTSTPDRILQHLQEYDRLRKK